MESTVSRPRCPHCGFDCSRVHDTRPRKIRDLEVSGRPTTLVWMRRLLSWATTDGARSVMSKSRIERFSITKPQVRGLCVAPKPHYSAVS
ncbi:MAG: transposase family protein [Gemmatimonadetes bacterium]|nr:transposase family protein [Gemmatimonadota bacterium]